MVPVGAVQSRFATFKVQCACRRCSKSRPYGTLHAATAALHVPKAPYTAQRALTRREASFQRGIAALHAAKRGGAASFGLYLLRQLRF